MAEGTALLIDVLPAVLEGSLTFDDAEAQDASLATRAPKLDRREGELRLWAGARHADAEQAHADVCAFAGWPGTTIELGVATLGGAPTTRARLKVLATRPAPAQTPPAPPAWRAKLPWADHEVVVAPGPGGEGAPCLWVPAGGAGAPGGWLVIERLQAPGKKPVSADVYCNGLRSDGRRLFVVEGEEIADA